MTTGRTIALTIQTFFGRVLSLLFNTLYRFVIAFLPKANVMISWLQSPSSVTLNPPKRKSITTSILFHSICHEVTGPDPGSIPGLGRQWHPTLVLLPGKSHGQRSLVGCSPWGHKELDTTEQLHFHFLFHFHFDGARCHDLSFFNI